MITFNPLRLFKQNKNVRPCATLSEETLAKIQTNVITKKQRHKLEKTLTKLPGDENTIISIYHNSKRTFFTRPGQDMNFLKTYKGTFVSFSKKHAPENTLNEIKISDKELPIDEKILDYII